MKRFITLLLVAAMCFAASACGVTKKEVSSSHTASTKESSSDGFSSEISSDETSSEESSPTPATTSEAQSFATTSAPAQQQTPASQTQTPKPVTPPKSSAPQKPAFDHDAYVKQIFNETNAYRAECGVAPLVWDPIANEMAEVRAREITQRFDHTRPDGRLCYTVVNDFPQYHDKYQPYDGSMLAVKQYIMNGENIVYCPASYSAVALWKNSPGHAENMRRSEFSHIGIGVYQHDNRQIYSVQIFFTEYK